MRTALIITGIVATIGSNALAEDAAVRSHPIEECLVHSQRSIVTR